MAGWGRLIAWVEVWVALDQQSTPVCVSPHVSGLRRHYQPRVGLGFLRLKSLALPQVATHYWGVESFSGEQKQGSAAVNDDLKG